MKTVSMTIILASLLFLTVGCSTSVKIGNTLIGNQVVEKKPFDPVEGVKGLCRGTIFGLWDVITLGYDKNVLNKRNYKAYTYNPKTESMKSLEDIADDPIPRNYFGGDYHATRNYTDRDRSLGIRDRLSDRTCFGYGSGFGFGYGSGSGFGSGFGLGRGFSRGIGRSIGKSLGNISCGK
jgi:hypothetical protein